MPGGGDQHKRVTHRYHDCNMWQEVGASPLLPLLWQQRSIISEEFGVSPLLPLLWPGGSTYWEEVSGVSPLLPIL